MSEIVSLTEHQGSAALSRSEMHAIKPVIDLLYTEMTVKHARLMFGVQAASDELEMQRRLATQDDYADYSKVATEAEDVPVSWERLKQTGWVEETDGIEQLDVYNLARNIDEAVGIFR